MVWNTRYTLGLVLLVACNRGEPRAQRGRSNAVVPGPNGLQAPRVAAADNALTRRTTSLQEGRHKPPRDKPYDDDARFQVRAEWYPTGQPANPYPAGTVIPTTPPGGTPGVTITPLPGPGTQPGMPPGMQPGIPPGVPPPVTMTPIPGPGVPGQPGTQPGMQPGIPPGMPPGVPPPVTMTPIPGPGVPSQPGVQPPPGVPPTPTAPGVPGQGTGGAAAFQRSFEGDLGGTAGPDGRYQSVQQVTLRRGQRVTVALTASFDTVLRVEPPTGAPFENDDISPENLNSRVEFTAPLDGSYRLVATSYEAGATGRYRMEVTATEPGVGMTTVTGPGAGAAPGAQVGNGGLLAPGTPVSEYLSPGDPSSGGRYVRVYRLRGRAGDMVRLRLESSAFDPTLALVGPDGHRWANDDTSSADTNSTVDVTLPQEGEYRVEVSSYREGATGPFTLTTTLSGRPVVGPGGQVAQFAGRQGQGVTYGVFVGITDYGSRGNLYGCADDARQLAQAYVNAHLGTAANFTVLTDAQATTTAVRQAFQQLAGRVGPQDVFMFFHSGHGNRQASQDRQRDPDGFVESIVLRDGELTSHELARLFDGVRADVHMLALDSCFSGGFERSFASAPNRYGMYSSEEDVLSQVAQRYQAGGYLSYYLRRAVEREGDGNHDGTLRAGELANYLHDRYQADHAQLGTNDGAGQDTWQRLVLNRSGIAINDMLWRYPAAQ